MPTSQQDSIHCSVLNVSLSVSIVSIQRSMSRVQMEKDY